MDSQAIVNTMEVLETKPINELVTEAVIKVCYVSENPNRNGTVINKEVGKQIAATLPGAPVVGLFDEDTGDFVEHSRQVIIKDGVAQIKDLTKPYGFVSFEAPWYQDFMEDGEVRTYLMCKAYLWTRQYAEASSALNKGQSMELDENSMSGYYEGDVFVFSTATLDKLCILGDAYEPCFEGASIMATYAKAYNKLAEQVEDVIGKRYYVLDGKLAEKQEEPAQPEADPVPADEPITLDYALQLGWNLNDAIYMQLRARGAEDWCIQGVYTQDGEIFAILQNQSTMEFVQVGLTINADETVTLGAEMIAVTQTWTPKDPPEPEPVEPLGGDEVKEPENSAATSLEDKPAPTPAPASDSVPRSYIDDGTVDKGEPQEPEVEPEGQSTYSAEGGQSNEPAEPAEPEAEPAPDYTAKPEEKPAAEPEAEPAPDYAAINAELTERVSALELDLAARDTRITELESQLETYKAAEAEAVKAAKNEMIESYRTHLSEEELAPVIEHIDEFTVDEIESKLAVSFARKSKSTSAGAATGIQLNIGGISTTPDANLPEFMKQAMEFERAHALSL